MSFRTSLPIDVVVTKVDPNTSIYCQAGYVYAAADYRSTVYATEVAMAKAIKKRFPAAVIDGKSVDVVYPDVQPDPDPVLQPVQPVVTPPPAIVPPPTPGTPAAAVRKPNKKQAKAKVEGQPSATEGTSAPTGESLW